MFFGVALLYTIKVVNYVIHPYMTRNKNSYTPIKKPGLRQKRRFGYNDMMSR